MSEPAATHLIGDIEVRPADASGRAWLYVPPRPSLETGPGGTPMLSVTQAGPVAFLQCTVRVDLTDDARRALLARVRDLDARAESLEPASLRVDRVSFDVREGDAWSPVATGRSLGLPPWTAALAGTLAPGALEAVKAALAGERDRARLAASIALAGTPAVQRSWSITRDTEARRASAGEIARSSTRYAAGGGVSAAARPPDAREIQTDLSTLFSTHTAGR